MNSVKTYKNIYIKELIILLLLTFINMNTKAQVSFYGDPLPVKVLNTSKNESFLALDRANHRLLFTRDSGLNSDGNIRSFILTVSDLSPIKIYSGNQYLTSSGTSLMNNDHFINKTHFERGRYYSQIIAMDRQKEEKELQIGDLDNLAPTQSGHISADGKRLLISAQKKNGYGVEDIYISKKENGRWSAVQGLGFDINTEFQEISPFLAADNKTLIFASNRKGGYGSMDLYITERLDDSWRRWSEPRNLGAAVNTSGAESSMVFFTDDEFAYYISTKDSDGYGDIKKIRIKSEIEPAEIDSVKSTPIFVADAESFSFILKDAKSNITLKGMAFYMNNTDTVWLEPKGEQLLWSEVNDQPESIEFKAVGYLSATMVVDVEDVGETIEVFMEPLSKGNIITLKNVLFHRGTANFVEGTQRELDLVVEMLNENPEVTIFLTGHTDDSGDSRLNTRLSEQRVLTVKNYLTKQGIKSESIDGKGFGGSQPKFSNSREQSRKLNRRVEFEIVRD